MNEQINYTNNYPFSASSQSNIKGFDAFSNISRVYLDAYFVCLKSFYHNCNLVASNALNMYSLIDGQKKNINNVGHQINDMIYDSKRFMDDSLQSIQSASNAFLKNSDHQSDNLNVSSELNESALSKEVLDKVFGAETETSFAKIDIGGDMPLSMIKTSQENANPVDAIISQNAAQEKAANKHWSSKRKREDDSIRD